MSLEKLLIFGFSIAAVGAVVVMATSLTTKREGSISPFKTEVQKMVDKTK